MDNDKIAEVVRELAARFGTTTEYLWPRVVAYRQAEAWSQIILSVVALLAVALVVWKLLPWLFRKADESPDDPGPTIGFIFGICAAIAGSIISFCVIATELPAAFAPEGAVVHDIVSKAK